MASLDDVARPQLAPYQQAKRLWMSVTEALRSHFGLRSLTFSALGFIPRPLSVVGHPTKKALFSDSGPSYEVMDGKDHMS
jgi:hypothetical protein